MPRSKTRTASSAAVSSYWTILRLPTTIISRTLRGASQEIWMLAVAPLANVSVMNAVSGTPSWKTLRPGRGDLDDRLVEPVQQDRQVVRREVADDAVGLVLAEVHARRRDEVDLAERAGVDQLLDLVDRRAVDERVARHQRAAVGARRSRSGRARPRTSSPAASRRARACRPRAPRARSRGACAAAWRRRPRRSSSSASTSSRSSNTGCAGVARPRTPRRGRGRARTGRRTRAPAAP